MGLGTFTKKLYNKAKETHFFRKAATTVGVTAGAGLFLFNVAKAQTPTVNGLFFGDGDYNKYTLLKEFTDAKVFHYIDGNTVYMAVVMNGLNDNVFGDHIDDKEYLNNALWNNHNFKHLVQSDHIELVLQCGEDNPWSFWQDYAHQDEDGTWLSTPFGPDGKVLTSLPPDFVSTSSFARNINYHSSPSSEWDITLGGTRTSDTEFKSPDNGSHNVLTDGYVMNNGNWIFGWSATHQWEWPLVYEMSFTKGDCNTVEVKMLNMHNSPSKDNPLPVELTSQKADIVGEKVYVSWITESEIENLGFLLDRITNNTSWTNIADYRTDNRLLGQGSVTHQTEYDYIDEFVGDNQGYRLADVDYDGVVTYHDPFEAKVTQQNPAIPSSFKLGNAYPNPGNPGSNMKLPIEMEEAGTVNVIVFDMLGRTTVNQYNKELEAGTSLVPIFEDVNTSSGVYFINVRKDNEVQSQKVTLEK